MFRKNLSDNIPVVYRPTFWAVFWGAVPTPEIIKKHPEALRMNGPKTDHALDACKYNFGMIAENMWVLNLGTIQSRLHNSKYLKERFNDTKSWVRVGKPGTDCQDHWHCNPDLASHICEKADRTKSCPYCGQEPDNAQQT